jgi:hypothetical protein
VRFLYDADDRRPNHDVALCAAQGVYFLVTGVWPLLSMSTFEAVSGPKTDDWLVKTVGALVTVIAIVLLTSAARRSIANETRLLAVAAAAALAAVDIVYSSTGVISKIYLIDAAVEFAFIAGWAWLSGNLAISRNFRG